MAQHDTKPISSQSLEDRGYTEVRIVGKGHYGSAHLVRCKANSMLFIAKKVNLAPLSEKGRSAASQEVDLLRKLNHPNIVEHRDDFVIEGDNLVIIMHYCEGGDMATYIRDVAKKNQFFMEHEIMNWFVQILQALQFCHRHKVLHRDLKTSNVFLTNSARTVKLGDFGISRVLEGTLEAAVTVVGTPYYMSPEVCKNSPYTFKSDVWSLGCVLYELCVLKHAFSASNLLGLVYKIVQERYEAIPSHYSEGLGDLIARLLRKKAEKRPSVDELLDDPFIRRTFFVCHCQ